MQILHLESAHTCMQYIVEQIPALAMPDVCTNSPLPGKAFCQDHCKVLEAKTPPIPTDLRGFLQHCRVFRGKSKADFPFIYTLSRYICINTCIYYIYIHLFPYTPSYTCMKIQLETP